MINVGVPVDILSTTRCKYKLKNSEKVFPKGWTPTTMEFVCNQIHDNSCAKLEVESIEVSWNSAS
jgi:hypothetical protein